MTQEWSVPAWALIAAAAFMVFLVAALLMGLRSSRRRIETRIAETTQAASDLAAQVAQLEQRLSPNPAAFSDPASAAPNTDADFVITRMGESDDSPAPREGEYEPLPPAVFTDLVLRESAVRAAGFVAGLRRALSPETRNRIRFEMKQEVKRSRKQRKSDLRVARREWEERQRSQQGHQQGRPQEGAA